MFFVLCPFEEAMQTLIISSYQQSCPLQSCQTLVCHSLFPHQTYLNVTIFFCAEREGQDKLPCSK